MKLVIMCVALKVIDDLLPVGCKDVFVGTVKSLVDLAGLASVFVFQ